MTDKEYQELVAYYPLVVKSLYPDIDYIPQGDRANLGTLQQNWNALDVKHPRPTEGQLLEHLAIIRAERTAQQAEINGLKADLQWMVGGNVSELLESATDSRILLKACLICLGAIGRQGVLQTLDRWLPYE